MVSIHNVKFMPLVWRSKVTFLAKPNYQFEKRQKEMAKKNKKEEKRRQKVANIAGDEITESDAVQTPDTSASVSDGAEVVLADAMIGSAEP